jgi:hypothetical protein
MRTPAAFEKIGIINKRFLEAVLKLIFKYHRNYEKEILPNHTRPSKKY